MSCRRLVTEPHLPQPPSPYAFAASASASAVAVVAAAAVQLSIPVEQLEQAVRGEIRTRGAGLRQLEGMGPTRWRLEQRTKRISPFGRAVSEFFECYFVPKMPFFSLRGYRPAPRQKSSDYISAGAP